MKRIPEAELMMTDAQARAYAEGDFASAHSLYPVLFAQKFPRRSKRATILDLGCGPADVTIRFAKANPGYTFHGVDGSPAMLKYGRKAVAHHRGLSRRINLIKGLLPGAPIPRRSYDAIICTNFLHHLHHPQVLWKTIRQYSRKGTIVFVTDLRRPATRLNARKLTEQYSRGEPAVLRRDYFNSLLAAFTAQEVKAQLRQAGLGHLKVERVSDRHLVVFGTIARSSKWIQPGAAPAAAGRDRRTAVPEAGCFR